MMNNRSTFYLLISLLFLFCVPNAGKAQDYGLPVMKGVQGFGFDARGGTGGKIVRVTNLNKSGQGSLKEAIQTSGPRLVVFEVAGRIDLEGSSLKIDQPFITIAGQTAPDPGITLIRGGIGIVTHEVILQHIRVRPGEAGHKKKEGWEIDGIATAQGAWNVIIDHCSASWATDENISPSGPRFQGAGVEEWRRNTSHRVLISNCIIAEGLSHSTHSKGEHSKGTLIHDNATEIAVIGNLYANNRSRNPMFKGGSQGIAANNYIYNPGREMIHYNLVPAEWEGHEWVTGKMTVEGNVIEFGSDTPKEAFPGQFRGPVEVYWHDNKIIPETGEKTLGGTHTLVERRPVFPAGFVPTASSKVIESVLLHAGARPWNRDAVDERIIREVKGKKGRIIDGEQQVGGYPSVKPVQRTFVEKEWDMVRLVQKK